MHGTMAEALPLFAYRRKKRWGRERSARLKALWTDKKNFSAEEVSEKLSTEFNANISRSAVLAKIQRMGLVGRRLAGINVGGSNPNRGLHKTTWVASPLASIGFGAPVSVSGLTSTTCRWPVGDPGTQAFAFCGAKPFQEFVYCECHARLAYPQIS